MPRTQRQIEAHRKGDAGIQVRDSSGQPCPGVRVWVEQETHEFRFGCVVPEPSTLADYRLECYRNRLTDLFNHLIPVGQEPALGVLPVAVTEPCPLGRLRLHLDQLAAAGQQLEVHIDGKAFGLIPSAGLAEEPAENERTAADRVAGLYTLCFAHPAVRGVIWNGFMDGERADVGGLLRGDLSPRRAYRFLQKLIGTIWHSRASGDTDAEGRFSFRGFFGDYRVTARAGFRPATGVPFSLRCGAIEASCLVELRA